MKKVINLRLNWNLILSQVQLPLWNLVVLFLSFITAEWHFMQLLLQRNALTSGACLLIIALGLQWFILSQFFYTI